MRIAKASDLHLEFGTLVLKNTGKADVLILAGDICVARDLEFLDTPDTNQIHRANRYIDFFKQVSAEFPQVVYVLGNHEHYHGDFKYSLDIIKNALAKFPNIHVLEKEVYELADVVFIGTTLWTDMNRACPHTLMSIKSLMNDFRGIKNSHNMISRKVPLYEDKNPLVPKQVRNVIGYKFKSEASTFSPTDAMNEHYKSFSYIRTVVANNPDKKYVVVTHHCPSRQSCHEKWRGDYEMNGGFYSELGDYIVDRPEIKLWAHGHTHDPFDYLIGETRIVCNPRGYIGHEPQAQNYDVVYVDI